MATGFNAQTGGGLYRLQFETDNEEYFLMMQELARCCVDHPKVKTNADRIRADWQNVVVQRYSRKIIWKGYEVLRVDAPGDRIVLDGGVLGRDWEEWNEPC